ncbi:TNF receptor-associated factor 4-like [Stylophora pistillata]|uniref:TNF receptor-associated factor 4-like n=1 Tax=Stylophora pistillata TaxID=50429 RepID=UPI000C051368|nr:TNF receptor-associated factor 4-like [Stylophora pistillata]
MAEASKTILPLGYVDEFVTEVERDLECSICHFPLKDPVLTRCGHRFCKECLEENFRWQEADEKPFTCPEDRGTLDRKQDVFPDKATERKILSFAIKCPSDGCEWTGELRNKETHLNNCLFKVIPCTNENCLEEVQRQQHKQHVTATCQWRILKCSYCSEPHPECQMQDHIRRCLKLPVTCPNSCGLKISREMIPSHIKEECLLAIVCCPYVQMGCETKVERQAVESHLQSAVGIHLGLTVVKLNEANENLGRTQSKLDETETKLSTTNSQLLETKKKTDDLKKEVETLQKQFKEKAVKDQENAMKEQIVMGKSESPGFSSVYIWKIDEFSKLMREAEANEEMVVDSASFYTENHGYKLKVMIYAFFDRQAEHVLPGDIFVMKGQYDAILPWPFNRKIKFTIMNQQEDLDERDNIIAVFIPDSDRKCYARPKNEENIGHGERLFISQTQLESRRYVVDDTLFTQVEVDSPRNLRFGKLSN